MGHTIDRCIARPVYVYGEYIIGFVSFPDHFTSLGTRPDGVTVNRSLVGLGTRRTGNRIYRISLARARPIPRRYTARRRIEKALACSWYSIPAVGKKSVLSL